MEQGRTSHGVSVRGGTTCLIAVVCHTGTPLEILYYAVAAAGPSGGSQLEDVGTAWDALQSELAAEVGRWEDLPRFWCPSPRKSGGFVCLVHGSTTGTLL